MTHSTEECIARIDYAIQAQTDDRHVCAFSNEMLVSIRARLLAADEMEKVLSDCNAHIAIEFRKFGEKYGYASVGCSEMNKLFNASHKALTAYRSACEK